MKKSPIKKMSNIPLQNKNKGVILDKSYFEDAGCEYLICELEKAIPFLQIPIIGMTLYKIAELLKFNDH